MSMSALWNMMNDASEAQTPIFLLTALHQRFPQFAEKDAAKGVWKQQDANEAWLAIVQFLSSLKVTIALKIKRILIEHIYINYRVLTKLLKMFMCSIRIYSINIFILLFLKLRAITAPAH